MAGIFARLGLGGKPPNPPGDFDDIEGLERYNRRLLIGLAATHGPIFKIKEEGQPQICVVGIERGRALLKYHKQSLKPINIDITPIVKAGFMRHMAGDAHKHYRSALISAVTSLSTDAAMEDCNEITRTALQHLATANNSRDDAPIALHDMLSEISTGFLIRIFFGVRPRTASYQRITELFRKLGPHGVIWNVGEPQRHAFDTIARTLREMLSTNETATVSNLISLVDQEGHLDATMLGNLIYMVEIGRYDLAGLFTWICRNVAVSDDISHQMRAETDGKMLRDFARAFTLETLRMDQSERLIRKVTSDFAFQGFQFPKDWRVRVCMWESHKLPENFTAPFDFNPSRFLRTPPSPSIYSPFGLDHHQCPLSALSVALAAQFLLTLVGGYDVFAVNDGPSVRGPYHWQPPVDFFVRLHPVSGAYIA